MLGDVPRGEGLVSVLLIRLASTRLGWILIRVATIFAIGADPQA